MESAPKIDLWEVMINDNGAPVLWGQVSGHPRLGDTDVRTSRLIGADRVLGWARTYGRWYALGQSLASFETEVADGLGQPDAPPGFLTVEMTGFRPLRDWAVLAAIMDDFLNRLRAIREDEA